MPFSGDDENPMESWIDERRTETLAAYDEKIPSIYRRPIDLHHTAKAWADGGPKAPLSLFLTGSIGVGKTHTAWQSSRRWISRQFQGTYRGNPIVQAWRSTQLFDALRADSGGGIPKVLMHLLQTADLLYIDDLAAARVSPTGWTQERLYEIFDERYINNLPVLITCDVTPDKISHIVGDRVCSRLAEMCRDGVVLLTGADRRKDGAA
ncbi:DnaA ATPase domain-containing protein [Streptomyces xanthophaeus]